MSVTEADREKARDVILAGDGGPESWTQILATALAAEREKARSPFLALNPMAYCNTQSGNGDAWDRGWVNAMEFITYELRRIAEES